MKKFLPFSTTSATGTCPDREDLLFLSFSSFKYFCQFLADTTSETVTSDSNKAATTLKNTNWFTRRIPTKFGCAAMQFFFSSERMASQHVDSYCSEATFTESGVARVEVMRQQSLVSNTPNVSGTGIALLKSNFECSSISMENFGMLQYSLVPFFYLFPYNERLKGQL